MKKKTVLINSLETYYEIAGSGPAILILHGWGGSSSSWAKIKTIISEKGYKVICPDFPGFGKSQVPKTAWGVSEYVEWTRSFIKSLGLNKVFIIGHSFGGRVAISLTSNYPENVESLILCSAAGIKHNPNLKTKTIFKLAKIGNAIFSLKFLTGIKNKARDFFYIFLRHQDYAKANPTMRGIMKEVLAEDLSPLLLKINVKTLIVWGDKDEIVSSKDAFIFKEKIEISKLEFLSGVGHSPHLEEPEKLADIILKFLN